MDTINAGINARLFDYILHSIQKTAYYKLLGIELTLLAPGEAELTVQAGEKHTNPMGKVHGGLIMSIADAAMGNAIRSLGITAVTADCSVSFPGAAQLGDRVTAKGMVNKSGKNLVFAEAQVYANEKMIGQSKGTFYKIGDIEL